MKPLESRLNPRDPQFRANEQAMRLQIGDLHAQMALHAAARCATRPIYTLYPFRHRSDAATRHESYPQ